MIGMNGETWSSVGTSCLGGVNLAIVIPRWFQTLMREASEVTEQQRLLIQSQAETDQFSAELDADMVAALDKIGSERVARFIKLVASEDVDWLSRRSNGSIKMVMRFAVAEMCRSVQRITDKEIENE